MPRNNSQRGRGGNNNRRFNLNDLENGIANVRFRGFYENTICEKRIFL